MDMSINISNERYEHNSIGQNDFFVCAIGNESRSVYMLKSLLEVINKKRLIVFCFDDIIQHNEEELAFLEEIGDAARKVEYTQWQSAIEYIQTRYQECERGKDDVVNIHIDYSSMPRGWYSRIPQNVGPILENKDKLYFWYVEAQGYPTISNAGIKEFRWFSGKPTIRPDNKRIHILALGLDTIRTQAALSMLDPDSYITCLAYDSLNSEIKEKVESANIDIRAHSVMNLILPIDNFEFMISKLNEIVRAYLYDGDVVLVPDGPKPLIFAMSLVPNLVKKEGVSCLHIVRNKSYEIIGPENNVKPTNNIVGFSISYK